MMRPDAVSKRPPLSQEDGAPSPLCLPGRNEHHGRGVPPCVLRFLNHHHNRVKILYLRAQQPLPLAQAPRSRAFQNFTRHHRRNHHSARSLTGLIARRLQPLAQPSASGSDAPFRGLSRYNTGHAFVSRLQLPCLPHGAPHMDNASPRSTIFATLSAMTAPSAISFCWAISPTVRFTRQRNPQA